MAGLRCEVAAVEVAGSRCEAGVVDVAATGLVTGGRVEVRGGGDRGGGGDGICDGCRDRSVGRRGGVEMEAVVRGR